MTPAETFNLLRTIAALDRRTVGEADALAWHATLRDLPYADCRDAVVAHYRDSADWIMPAHVRQRVRAARRERLARTPVPDPPPEMADHPGRYQAWVAAKVRQIADGKDLNRELRRSGAPPIEAA